LDLDQVKMWVDAVKLLGDGGFGFWGSLICCSWFQFLHKKSIN
jgi:hypothetical protein